MCVGQEGREGVCLGKERREGAYLVKKRETCWKERKRMMHSFLTHLSDVTVNVSLNSTSVE